MLADKVSALSRQRAELLDRHSKIEAVSEKLTKELEEKKELVNTLYMKHQLEKQVTYAFFGVSVSYLYMSTKYTSRNRTYDGKRFNCRRTKRRYPSGG